MVILRGAKRNDFLLLCDLNTYINQEEFTGYLKSLTNFKFFDVNNTGAYPSFYQNFNILILFSRLPTFSKKVALSAKSVCVHSFMSEEDYVLDKKMW